jgi:hypothetical protein
MSNKEDENFNFNELKFEIKNTDKSVEIDIYDYSKTDLNYKARNLGYLLAFALDSENDDVEENFLHKTFSAIDFFMSSNNTDEEKEKLKDELFASEWYHNTYRCGNNSIVDKWGKSKNNLHFLVEFEEQYHTYAFRGKPCDLIAIYLMYFEDDNTFDISCLDSDLDLSKEINKSEISLMQFRGTIIGFALEFYKVLQKYKEETTNK